MKTIEIYMPCIAYTYYTQSGKHERWDSKFEFNYCGYHYMVHYCVNCCRYISRLNYDYGYFTKILHYLFMESGIFFPIKIEFINGCLVKEYPDDDCFTWVKKYDGRHYEVRKELLNDSSYELVGDDNYNLFFLKKQ